MSELTLLWVLPLGGAVACLVAGRFGRAAARTCALIFGAAYFVVSLAALMPFVATRGVGLDAVGGAPLAFGVSYLLAADGLSLSLILLTAFLNLVCVISSWENDVPAGYWANFLALASALTGVFLARDLFLFYMFWEATLIPMFFIIGLWGSANRRHAAVKFFLFTFAGSVFMLLALIALVVAKHGQTGTWTWDLAGLQGAPVGAAGPWIFLGLLLGFGVKIPVVPLHTWLPDAHTEAPAAGSVMLAGVMLKMGLYGLIRIALPLFPVYAQTWAPVLAGLAAVNAVYGALCAMAQTDLKRLVAYSSIAHLGFCLLGILSGAAQGVAGGSLQMINHGITTGALFLMVGFLYERSHKRGLADFGELANTAPWLSFFFGFAMFASIGLPGLNGFVGEFMCLSGISHSPIPMLDVPFFAVAGVLGVTLAAAYMLPAYQAVFWAPKGPESVSEHVFDLTFRERSILWALCGLMLWIGLAPSGWLDLLEPSVRGLVR
ncbi:MAG TPA: NADH-quinone oxidoreductase subunit M [Elusimicrobiota bacterium]|nr:NADH-quinone oxidoreductase subunit M [Elusimicrobiota bacterium]